MLDTVCLSQLHAYRVDGSGRQPQLYVYEGQGNFASLQKSSVADGGAEPRWEDTICVSLLPRVDSRTCFDIRDHAAGMPTDKLLLHFGCTTLSADSVGADISTELTGYSIRGKPHATVSFSVLYKPPVHHSSEH